MSTITMIKTPGRSAVMPAALGTPLAYGDSFAGVNSAASRVQGADAARKWARPPRGTPR